ncbi:MAG: FHA domain-containing protein [Microcoleus sp. SIO2G3]|nr:FHA domain-containing protein [Microcoleus sp. SIO2G3]
MPSEYQSHLLIVEDDKGRREFALGNSVYSIGRDPTCDICLVSQFVSKRHATLIRQSNEDGSIDYQIVDGRGEGRGSTNGMYINGVKHRGRKLQHEDEVILGPFVKLIYLCLMRDAFPTSPPDELENTVKSPRISER